MKSNKKVWIGVAVAIVAVVLVLVLSRHPTPTTLDIPADGAGLVETQSGTEIVVDEHLDNTEDDYPPDEQEAQSIDEYEAEDTTEVSYSEDNYVEFNEDMLIKPADMDEEDAVAMGMMVEAFVTGLWNRPPSDNTQYDAFIRMWEKYGCASDKAPIIAAFTKEPAPKRKMWRNPDGGTEARVGSILIEEKDATTNAWPVTVATAVFYTDAPSVSLFGDPGGEFFTVKEEGDGWCVATQEGLSLDWAKTQR